MIHWSLQAAPSREAPALDRGEEALTAAERARLAGFGVPRRRADWLAGRIAAKSAVAAALEDVARDPPLRAIEIENDESGMPHARIAPGARPVGRFAPGERLPLSVSLSHAEGSALAAATWSRPPGGGSRRALGVDLAFVEPRSREFGATFFTEEERRLVADVPPSQRDLYANLVWCIKEAVVKALGRGLTVDTLELSCRPGADLADAAEWPMAPSHGDWRPFVASCGPALLPGGGTVLGIWRTFAGFVGALASHVRPL